MSARLLVFAKAPVPGQVKTRLVPALDPEEAAALHARLVRRTVRTARDAGLAPVELWCAPDASHALFRELAAEGPLHLRIQQGGDLGERMAHALQAALRTADAAVLVGTDCPVLEAGYLARAFEVLEGGADAVLGPVEDGGYALVGLRRMHPRLFADVSWGTQYVLSQTRARLAELGWHWRELDTLWDLDRPEDLWRWEAVRMGHPREE